MYTTILVRILQKYRTNWIYVYIYKEIYYEELAHVVMEADRSQELQGKVTSWILRTADYGALV